MKKELRRDPNNKIIAGVCSVSSIILTLTLSLFALSGLWRFSYLEQVFYSTSFVGLLSQKKASGKL